jgi:hypothetical protein
MPHSDGSQRQSSAASSVGDELNAAVLRDMLHQCEVTVARRVVQLKLEHAVTSMWDATHRKNAMRLWRKSKRSSSN